MRDVEAIKYLPWFGQHHWRQTKGELRMELSLPGGSDGKELACRAGDLGLIPGSGRSPGGGNGNPFQYSWLGNPMDRGAWWATVHGVTKSSTWISDLNDKSSYPDTLTSPHCTWKGKAQEPFLWCEWKLNPQYCGAPFLLLRLAKNLSSMWRGYRETRKLVYFSVQFSCSLVSNSLRPQELQHPRLLCPSPTPRVHSNSCPLSQWCHPTISSSVIPSPPALNLSQHQGLFKWVSSSHQMAEVLEFQLQRQSFQWTLWTDLL